MKGYLNNPSATADSITADGWLKTGDIAVRDGEGYYEIVDRKRELIKYKVGLKPKRRFVVQPLSFRVSKVNWVGRPPLVELTNTGHLCSTTG